MPPSIPTSLNFGGVEGAPTRAGFLRWPKSVLGFLQGYLRRGGNGSESNQNGKDDSSSGGHSSTPSRPSRKASRVDSNADSPPQAGVTLACVDVGLQWTDEETNPTADERQAIIHATETVLASVRPMLVQHDHDQPPRRILLLGRNAEVRSQYLAHSSNFGFDSGTSPNDCVWPLVDQEGQVNVREEEGVHWSEDLTDLHQLAQATFDVVLVYSVQFNPTHLAATPTVPATPAQANNSNAQKHPTQQWFEKLSGIVREGGCIAGVVCLERGSNSATSIAPGTSSAFTPVQSVLQPSPSFATRASTGSLSVAPASSPLGCVASTPASTGCPFLSIRTMRDRVESLGFYVHAAVDMHLEGCVVLQPVEEEPSLQGGQMEPSKDFVPARLLATKNFSTPATAAASTLSPPGQPVRRSASSHGGGFLQRSSSFGTLSGSATGPSGVIARPNSRPLVNLSVMTGSSMASATSGSSSHSYDANVAASASYSPALSAFTDRRSSGQLGFPPTAAATAQSHPHRRAGSQANISPLVMGGHPHSSPTPSPLMGLGLPDPVLRNVAAVGGSTYSSNSSPSPSPKLSPGPEQPSSMQQHGVVGGELLNMLNLGTSSSTVHGGLTHSQQLALHSSRLRSDQSPFSGVSHASSSRSSPAMTPVPREPQTPNGGGMFVHVPTEPIVISGVAMGLPQNQNQPDRPIFSQLNFEDLFNGINFISQTTAEDKSKIIGMNSCQISKDKLTGARTKTFLSDEKQLIQVCSKMSPRESWNLAKTYGLPSHVIEVLDATYELAICAGLEALKDAGFNISLASENPTEIGLPESLRDETGVIFASSFPCLDSVVQEVTKYVKYQTAKELIEQCKDMPRPDGKDYQYEYDRKLLFKILVMANCQLAELIKARGPNVHINTACSGTTQAICTAEDWMRVGRCKRVIVISADVATNDNLFKYLGTGFLALGAASILPTPSIAAAPFDERRKGMILGAGSTGLVLEFATSCLARGGLPKVELVGSHQGNSAFHATLMDSVSISQQLNMFLKRIEQEKNLSFTTPSGSLDFCRDLIYFSHETSTSANGGCAKVEMQSLESIWSDSTQQQSSRHSILITNTKGLTGHPMGVGFEDVMAVETLHRGLIPPVANFQKLDPRLEPYILPDQISRGGSHQRNYVLRMAGGFGNQFAYVLYRKWNDTNTLVWQSRVNAPKAQAHSWARLPGYYHYPTQIAESPNSTFISRVNSDSNLQSLVLQ